jgi:uncharacterized Ntn-hydrolase superfamily protein
VSDAQRTGAELADRLLVDLKAGRREKVGLEDIEEAAAKIVARSMPSGALEHRLIVDWTIRFLVERLSR